MTMLEKSMLALLSIAMAPVCVGISEIARAQSYPTRPVRVLVPLAPGGSMDTIARALSQKLSEAMGQNFIVDNRPALELVSHLKAHPGKLNFASSGIGSPIHLSGELFMIATGTKMTHIPYKGMGSAYADLIAGNIELSFPTIVSSQAHIRAGRLRGLAVTGPKRAPAMPELPTMSQAGVQGVVVTNWYGILAPAGTPRAIVDRLNREIVNALRQPEMMKRLVADGSEAVGSSPEELRTHIAAERDKWTKLIKAAGIKGS